MTRQQIAGLGTALAQFLRPLYGCFSECRLLDHFEVYCRGLLSDLDRKTVEPIALEAGGTVRALQPFLTQHVWDEQRLADQLQQRVAQQHAAAAGGRMEIVLAGDVRLRFRPPVDRWALSDSRTSHRRLITPAWDEPSPGRCSLRACQGWCWPDGYGRTRFSCLSSHPA